ncbi:TPA: integrase, partial [Enterobacter roggenkampii]
MLNTIFIYLLKCTFEKVDFLRYALTVSLPPIFYAARRTEPDMILIPDDEPELSLPAASEEFLPA